MEELPANRSRLSIEEARRSALRSLGIIVLLFLAYALLPYRGKQWWVGALVGLALLAGVAPVMLRRLRRVMTSDQPVLEAAEALVLLVSMLIVGFASVYFAMNDNGNSFAGLQTRLDALYFTVTTLATVGYGDIHATSQPAEAVVTVQMVVNLLFLGVAVRVFARVVRDRTPQEP